jgi:hypothetical protein
MDTAIPRWRLEKTYRPRGAGGDASANSERENGAKLIKEAQKHGIMIYLVSQSMKGAA